MIDWEKNFAVIVQTSNLPLLIGRGSPGNNVQEFFDRAFGHAVMVLKVDGELHYKGYRFNIGGKKKLRKLCATIYANAQDQYLENEEIRKEINCIESILREGVRAEIFDEGKRYRPRHQWGVCGTVENNLVYYDLNYEEKEVNAIWTQVIQAEKQEKHYSLNPDIAKKTGNFPKNALVHNCVTWIIETQHVSVNRFLLDRIPEGNISQFADNLRRIGDKRETSEPNKN